MENSTNLMDNKCVKSETQCSEEETSATIKEFNKRCNINSSSPGLNPEDYISEKMFPDKIEWMHFLNRMAMSAAAQEKENLEEIKGKVVMRRKENP